MSTDSGEAHNAFIATRDVDYLFLQLAELFKDFYPAVVCALLMALVALPVLRREPTPAGTAFPGPNLRQMDRPLISRRANYFAYAFICSMLAFVLILGPHTGNYLNYSYQIVLPPFFLWLFCTPRPQSRLGLIMVPLLLINLVSFGKTRLDPAFLRPSRADSKAWARLYGFVDGSQRTLNSPLVVTEMIRLGMRPVDSGLTEFYYWTGDYPDDFLLWPNRDIIENSRHQYLKSMQTSIANQEFDRVIVTDRLDFFYDRTLISRYYHEVRNLSVDMPQPGQAWTVIIWEPNQPLQDDAPLSP